MVVKLNTNMHITSTDSLNSEHSLLTVGGIGTPQFPCTVSVMQHRCKGSCKGKILQKSPENVETYQSLKI